MRVHHINNVNKALQVLSENGVKLLNISSEDIVGGNHKLILGLIWIIALCFDGQKLVNSEAASGVEKNLLRWFRQFTDKYELSVNDFTSSWTSGLAFLYILHGFNIDFDLNWAMKQHPIVRLVISTLLNIPVKIIKKLNFIVILDCDLLLNWPSSIYELNHY